MVAPMSMFPTTMPTNSPMMNPALMNNPMFRSIFRNGGGVGNPAVTPSVTPNGPTINDLFKYTDPGASSLSTFQSGVDATKSNGLMPQYQTILDTIKKQQDYATGVGTSAAQSLAAKRGLTGSSVEQFGTQQAVEGASRAAQDASSSTLQASAQAQNALQQLQAQGYFNRANSLAQLGSDETASLRNADFSNRYLELQKSLGQQGLDISRENINANRDIARDSARNQLISTGLSGILSSGALSGLFGGGGGGGGGIPGFFGAGGNGGGGFGNSLSQLFSGMTLGGGASAVPYGGAGMPGSAQFPGGLGGVGTNMPGMFGAGGTLFNTAGTSALGAGNILPGFAGWQLGTQTFGDNRYTNIGGVAGGIGGSLFGPLGSAAGGFLGAGAGSLYGGLNDTGKALVNPFVNPGATVKAVESGVKQVGNAVSNVGSSIGNAVTSVFPF